MPFKDPERNRAAKRDHYARNRAMYAERNVRAWAAMRDVIVEAKARPCLDCGVQYPYWVMHFDHRGEDPKAGNIGTDYHRWSMRQLVEEIAKCDVVCANCHAERTHARQFATPQGLEPR